jgi:hypothetical protein
MSDYTGLISDFTTKHYQQWLRSDECALLNVFDALDHGAEIVSVSVYPQFTVELDMSKVARKSVKG